MHHLVFGIDAVGGRSATIHSLAAALQRLQPGHFSAFISGPSAESVSSSDSSCRPLGVDVQLWDDGTAARALKDSHRPSPGTRSSILNAHDGVAAWRGLGFGSAPVRPCVPSPCIPAAGVAALGPRQLWLRCPSLEALLNQRRLKSTKKRAWQSDGAAGNDRDESRERKRRHRRWRRFGPSTKIMDTTSLKELRALAAREVAEWNAKELAAAAHRTLTLWRLEQPAAAAPRGRRARRGPSLPPPVPSLPLQGPLAAPLPQSPSLPRSPPHRYMEASLVGGDGGSPSTFLARAEKEKAGGWPVGTGADGWVDDVGNGGGGGGGGGASRKPARPQKGVDGVAAAGPVESASSWMSSRPPAPMATAAEPKRPASDAVSRTTLVHRRLRPHEQRLAELVELLVRGARARLGQQAFGSRELATFIWSLTRLGYWQPPLLQLVSAFLDYRGERLRASNPIDIAVVLQVLAKASEAAEAGLGGWGQLNTAGRLLDLTPGAAAAAAATLPRCLPACESRTLAGLLHSCAVLLRPGRLSKAAHPALVPLPGGKALQDTSGGGTSHSGGTPGVGTTTATTTTVARSRSFSELESGPEPGPEPGSGLGSGSGFGRSSGSGSHAAQDPAAGDLTTLARQVVRECVRRRFVGFGPVGLLTAAGALKALQPALSRGSSEQRCRTGPDGGASTSGGDRDGGGGSSDGGAVGSSAGGGDGCGGSGRSRSGGGGPGGLDDVAEAWGLLEAAAVSPMAPEMAGSSPEQWRRLLKLAPSRTRPSKQLLTAAAAAAASTRASRLPRVVVGAGTAVPAAGLLPSARR